jgi:hypothetical protein
LENPQCQQNITGPKNIFLPAPPNHIQHPFRDRAASAAGPSSKPNSRNASILHDELHAASEFLDFLAALPGRSATKPQEDTADWR